MSGCVVDRDIRQANALRDGGVLTRVGQLNLIRPEEKRTAQAEKNEAETTREG